MSSESFLPLLRFFVSSFIRGRVFELGGSWLIQGMDVLSGSSYKAEIMGMETNLYSH